MSGNAQTRLENRGMYCIDEWETFKKQLLSAFTIKPKLRYTYFTEYKPSRRKGESVAAFIDRVTNNLDSFDNLGRMSEERKHKEIRRILSAALPAELHYGLPHYDTVQELIEEVEIRAGKITNVKHTHVDIASERLEETPWQVSTAPITAAVKSADSVLVAEQKEKITSSTTTADKPPTVAATAPATQATPAPPSAPAQSNAGQSKKKGKGLSQQQKKNN